MGFTLISKSYEDLAARSGQGVQGNFLDTNTATYIYEYTSKINLSPSFAVQKVGDTMVLLSGDWESLIGAFNGANIQLTLSTNSVPVVTTTISFVDGAEMTLVNGGNWNDGIYDNGFFQVTDPLEQFDMNFNLAPNSSGGNPNSLIDGEEVRFSCVLNNALTVSGLTDDFTQLGNKSGGSKFPIKTIQLISDVSGVKQYRIILEFKYWVFLDLTPFAGSAAVGVYNSVTGYMIQGDPSVTVNHSSFQQGGTGGEDENFNGIPSNYTLDFITWTDNSANNMSACDYTQESNFNLEILGNFSAFAKFNIKMFTIPEDTAEFSNLPNPVDNNVMVAVNTALITGGVPTTINGNLNDLGAGYDLQNVEFTIITSTKVIVTGKVVPNSAFTTLFEGRSIDDRKYKLLIQCEDEGLIKKAADTVNVLCDFQDMQENFIPLGKWGGVSRLDMSDHNNDVYPTTPDTHLEDDVLVETLFTLPKDTVNQPWSGISLRVVAQKTTGERFTLEEYFYDTSLIPQNTTTGVIPLSYSQDRGFKLPATSNKHDVVIELYPALDTGSDFGVRALYPFIMRYEDWIDLPQANNDFFGNKTNNWFNYSNDPNWQLQFEIGLQRSNGEYINDYKFNIRDYDDWGEVSGSSFSFTQADGVTVITKPYTDTVSKIIATHEIDTEDWSGNEWALIHARPEFGEPQWLIGSVLAHSDSANPLFPLSGETEGKLTVGTKIVTVEALFDPAKIDITGNVTFTTRINGNTTGGIRSNIFKQSYKLAQRPIRPQLRAQPEDEDRGGDFCCCPPRRKFADVDDSRDHRNDITGAWEVGDSVTFTLKKNGIATAYTPVSTAAPNQPDGWTTQINWREVLIGDGTGEYVLEVSSVVAGVTEPTYEWATYCLQHYASKVNDDKTIYNAEGTVRIRSEFNDYHMKQRFNFTDTRLIDTIRFDGKFGYVDPNTVVENTEYTDAEMQKIRRMDLDSYELRTGLICIDAVRELRMHVLGETRCWVSDHNRTSPEHYFNVDVIVKEGYKPEYFDGSKNQRGVVVFEDKVRDCRTFFQDPRQTAESVAPNPIEPTPIVNITGGAKLMKTNCVSSDRAGDDGDTQRGRAVSFFELEGDSPWGHPYRFCGLTGGYTDGASYFDVNGSPSSRAVEFADAITLDMSTLHTDGTILAYYYGDVSTNRDWNTSVDWALALAIDSKSDWSLLNRNEANNIINDDASLTLNYAPIAFNVATAIWTSTPNKTLGTYATALVNSRYSLERVLKTNQFRTIAVRYYTLTELGL